MLSFYYTCKDINLISEFICIDDNSSSKDFEIMIRMFPKVKFIKNQKGGQLESIKLLIENIDADYIFHTEDDWEFLIQDNYIQKCIEIIKTDKRIKQVILRFWDCMYVKHNDIEYRMHVYSPMDYKKDWDIIKHNDCTIGGLTLNPGLIDFKVFKECFKNVKQNDKKDRTWDREISKRFWDMGYKIANLCQKYIEHTGILCSCYPIGV
jgi:hypothetical protein